jgi:benzoyl-CoA reductase/2-hydroxyglutaryl-CoA dehydratase subunit BcrC/BadD/HgdB
MKEVSRPGMRKIPKFPSRSEVIAEHKAGGGFIAGILPIHYPRALLRAFNFLPVEIWGPPGVDSTFGEAHLQPYVCSIVRNALSFIHSSSAELVDVFIVPHACDSLQGLGSMLLDFVPPSQPVFPIYLPRGNFLDARKFLKEEFEALFRKLESITNFSPTESDLLEAILREEKVDAMLVDLHEKRSTFGLSNYEFYRLIRSREYLPIACFTQIAEEILGVDDKESSEGIPIMLSGILLEPMALLQKLDELGARIVVDDLACCGRRLYPTGESQQPYQRMAERILNAPPDWSRGSPIQARLDDLVKKCEAFEVKGVLFYNIKFCEPELFDIPELRKGLKDAGIQSTVIEVDINDPVSHQVLTRAEAFLEMIA